MVSSLDVGMDIGGGCCLINGHTLYLLCGNRHNSFTMVTFGGLSGSPKVTTVLQIRALAMNPRYIFVVSYQISSNMVAPATAPLRWRVLSPCPCFRFLCLGHFKIALEFVC